MRLFSKNFGILVGVVPAWIVPVWIGQDRFCGLRSWQSTSSVGFLFGHKILSDSWGAFSNHKSCNDQLFIAFMSMRKLREMLIAAADLLPRIATCPWCGEKTKFGEKLKKNDLLGCVHCKKDFRYITPEVLTNDI